MPGALASYVVRCSGAGAGSISFCDSADCSACAVTRAVGGAGAEACLANDAALFGSAAFSIKCPSLAAVERVEGVSPVRAGGFVVQWSADAACGGETSHRTLVVGAQGVCERVPAGVPGTGYSVTCDAAGSGRGAINL